RGVRGPVLRCQDRVALATSFSGGPGALSVDALDHAVAELLHAGLRAVAVEVPPGVGEGGAGAAEAEAVVEAAGRVVGADFQVDTAEAPAAGFLHDPVDDLPADAFVAVGLGDLQGE